MPDQMFTYKTVGDVTLQLHVFLPADHQPTDKRPGIVFFFGGGWKSGSMQHFYPQCEHLASLGMVAMAAEYRVESRHGTTPRQCVMDGKSAMRWVRANAARLGIDANRLAAGGGSAGGHVAAATATVDGFNEDTDDLSVSERPNALILFNPVFDNGPGGYGHDRVKDDWQSFSPMHNLDANTPPTVIFLGTKDHLIPVATAEKYKQLMEQNGTRCELHLYEGQGHGFFNLRHKENYDQTVAAMDAFLGELGWVDVSE